MGTCAALAEESYRFAHYALFSSELLRDYFRAHGIGVFADGALGERHSWSFQNAITDVAPPSAAELARRAPRRLLFYARPEKHASRNLFELGLLALIRAIEQGAFAGGSGWELDGIGTIDRHGELPLGERATLNLLARASQSSYARLLRDHDLGLALMYTPHPSLVPIEMAAAGMVTVTNSFENKTPGAMSAISSNLLTVTPSIEEIASGLHAAAAAADDVGARVRGGEVRWSRSWEQSFDDELIGELARALSAD
jgi:hypothetical protein